MFNKRNLKCAVCGRGFNEHSSDSCCPECFEIAGLDNHVNDDGREHGNEQELAEATRYLQLIARKGGDVQKVIESNEYLFPAGFEFTATASKPAGERANPHRGQKAMIRKLLQKKVSVPTIVARVNEQVGGKCTPGYVRWVAKRMPARQQVAA